MCAQVRGCSLLVYTPLISISAWYASHRGVLLCFFHREKKAPSIEKRTRAPLHQIAFFSVTRNPSPSGGGAILVLR